MHDLLQEDGAMLDCIAVPNFLEAYGIGSQNNA
jgi:hypothetical protein